MAVSLITKAQVGINTNNPQRVFHIDTRGNNAASGTPTAAQITDDVTIDASTTTGVNMAVGGTVFTTSSAQLSLFDANKAMLLNRVALTGLQDITTIPNPQAGMLVYNTATAGTFPNDIVPGFYYFNGIVWYKWQYGQLNSKLSQLDLVTTCYSTPVPSLTNTASPMQAALADFGTIKIAEKGVYLFSFRLYGNAQANSSGTYAPTFTRSVDYLFLMKNGSTKLAGVEINVPMPIGSVYPYTYTTTVQALLNKDDVVTVRLGHLQGYYGWSWYANPILGAANKTSLIYWKI